jgi:non-ribosomal peptide synthetase component F
MIVMRSDVTGDSTFVELLKQIREVSLQGLTHQDVTFEHLVDKLNPEYSVSYSPLFQVVFALQNSPVKAAKLSEFELTPLNFDHVDGIIPTRMRELWKAWHVLI